MRKLVHSLTIGLITTHDLALANIEQDLGRRAANVHFDDQPIEGRIDFDLVLRQALLLGVMHLNSYGASGWMFSADSFEPNERPGVRKHLSDYQLPHPGEMT